VTHAEFHAAVKAIANGRYFSTEVSTTEHEDGQIRLGWRAYIDGKAWTETHADPMATLRDLKEIVNPMRSLEEIGDVKTELGGAS